MRTFIITLFVLAAQISFAQQTNSTEVLTPISDEIREQLSQSVSIECTMLNSTKTFSIDGNNARVFFHVIDKVPPSKLTKSIDGYLMFVNAENNSLDANFYFGVEGESYVVFQVDEQNYYNKLTEVGVEFFNRFK